MYMLTMVFIIKLEVGGGEEMPSRFLTVSIRKDIWLSAALVVKTKKY